MVNKEHIDREVEKTLQSLDGTIRAEANPYLFTRLKARMQARNGWEQFTYYLSRPAVAFAVLLLVMVVNAVLIFNSDSATTTTEEGIAVNDIADEYNLASSSNYDY
jgi:hypothetical protein